MRMITICNECKSGNIDYLGNDKCYCNECKKETESTDKIIESPYERTRRQVYSTGNKWAIENFNATH